MRASPIFLLLATLAVTGCAEEPFANRQIDTYLDKPLNTVTTDGEVTVCHADSAPWAQVEAVAADACGAYGYLASHAYTRRYQCRLTAPHESLFACYHPEMTDANGKLINPSDEQAVAAWQKRTGKLKPKPRVALPEAQQQAVPLTLPSGPSAKTPSPAVSGGEAGGPATPTPPSNVPAYRPLSPADIAGKPALDAAPILAEPPRQMPLYPSGSGYTLQPESWGQQFDK